jgi:hypothetical protein
MKNFRVSNILCELTDEDSLRNRTCINAMCHLLNWVLFDPNACTVVLFTLLLAVIQRNLQLRCKSRDVYCHSTAMMWVWEVWSYIAGNLQGLYTTPTLNMMFPLLRCVIKVELQQVDKFVQKYYNIWRTQQLHFPNITLSFIYSAPELFHVAGRHVDKLH